MPAQHLAQRRRDGTLGENPRGQLVEQGLEGVVVGAVDERDLDGHAPQELGREQPAEATADDHHAMTRLGEALRTELTAPAPGDS